jgi:hypothetical protein
MAPDLPWSRPVQRKLSGLALPEPGRPEPYRLGGLVRLPILVVCLALAVYCASHIFLRTYACAFAILRRWEEYPYMSAESSGRVGGAPKNISREAAANGATPVETQIEVRMANKA